MTGRRRRFSTISVEDNEDKAPPISYLDESLVLKSVTDIADADEWPCFLLEDATIYCKDGETMGNLLDAELDGPYRVRGRLEMEKENRKHFLNKKFQSTSTYLEIKESQAYSIGYGPTTIWASGKSGWFEIQPAQEYKEIYDKILEGIDLYYAIVEVYEQLQAVPRRKGYRNKLTVDEILLKYAMKDGTGLTRPEVIQRIESHAAFLLTHMRKERLVKLENTAFYKWLSTRCPDIIQRLEKRTRVSARGGMRQANPVASLTPSSASPEATPSLSDRLSTQSPGTHDMSIANTIVNFMIDIDRTGQRKKHSLHLGPLCTLLFTSYRVPNRSAAQAVIQKWANEILDLLPKSWETTPIYAELIELAQQQSDADDSENWGHIKILVRREKRTSGPPNRISGPERTETIPIASPKTPARKSIPTPHRVRTTGGKVATLRLVSSPISATNGLTGDDTSSSEEEEEVEEITNARKRRRAFQPPSDEDSSQDSEETKPLNNPPTATTSKDAHPEFPPLSITSTSIPSTAPTGPNSTWICSEPDCHKVIRAANTEIGKREVQDHFLQHARELMQSSREALIKKESVANNLPVSHLLEKLKELGSQVSGPPTTINGKVVPQRIKRESMT